MHCQLETTHHVFLDTASQINLLSRATLVINHKAQKAELCRDELKSVSIEEIETAERQLLEGLDYRLRCHHPYGAIKVLSADIVAHLRSSEKLFSKLYGCGFPKAVQAPDGLILDTLRDRALAVAQAALVYSDVNFLFQPGKIAFAAVAIAIALEGTTNSDQLGSRMRNYLGMRFPQKTSQELADFDVEVTRIVSAIAGCPAIDTTKFSARTQRRRSITTQIRAAEVRRVFALAAGIRCRASMPGVTQHIPVSSSTAPQSRKRMRVEHSSTAQPQRRYCNAARVTPIQLPMDSME